MSTVWQRRTGMRIGRADVLGLGVPLIVYLGLVAFQLRDHPREVFDEYIFMDVGRQIATTGLPIRTFEVPKPEFFFDHTPLYVYWVALITKLGGPTFELVRITTLISGIATVVGVYVLARIERSPESGVVAALVLATNPFFATYSWFVRMEVPLCCCLVLATIALSRRRALLTGVLIAIAVLLKEIALAFWLVAAVYALARLGWKAALAVAIPSVVAFFGWFAYAASLSGLRLDETLIRWYTSAAGGDTDPRLKVRLSAWARTIVTSIVGWITLVWVAAAAPLAILDRRRIPLITVVPVAYVLVAVASSFVIKLKEPRYLIAIIPMIALTVGLSVDWGAIWARIRAPHPAP